MATSFEIRTEQKRRLTMLLRLKATAQDLESFNKTLNAMITDTEIEMEAEDVAYVQKKLEGSEK